MSQTIGKIIVLLLVIAATAAVDYFQTKNFREINKKIADDPNYLKDPEKKELCKKILQQVRYMGPFSILEMKKLKKSLDKFQ